MKTKMIHFTDSYARHCDSKVLSVTEHDGNILVELDQTCFYPVSGGQPSDTGLITKRVGVSDALGFVVSNAYKFDGKVLHVVNKPGLEIGDEVRCNINWSDRYTNMRFHTAIHIVTRLIERDSPIKVSSNNASLEKARIDFTLDDFDREYLASFEAKANELIKKNLPVKTYIISREKAKNDPDLFRLSKGFDESIQDIRIVQIGPDDDVFDRTACGGAHVANTSEIPPIEFLKLENKGAQRRRINFTLELGSNAK